MLLLYVDSRLRCRGRSQKLKHLSSDVIPDLQRDLSNDLAASSEAISDDYERIGSK